MKRLLFLTLSVTLSLIMMAGNVTPEQAREQAAQFMTNHLAKGRHARLAPSQPVKMAMPIQLEGLYLVNMDDNNGFVIVSNDDRTDAILGYSDSGSLDPDNMPDNMRAWLQGYADQIKWINEHGITAKASHRAAKTPIAPLVQTHWNQGAPYNNKVSTIEYYTSTGAVTGCVATAMAQVMYYTANKAGLSTSYTLDATESYTSNGKSIPVVPAYTELNWDQMRTEYTYSYNSETNRYDIPDFTSDEANAVATLMQACGAAVKMNYADRYNGGSSANSRKVPDALKRYFGYDESTKYKDRTLYTYTNWINMIYHELAEERPVYYCGQSSGGGHAFICDGYEGEDYFHINWGWGGTSDSYFKLSVLNPYEQGIGGSSSNDGYDYQQGAIVGIQLKGGTGTVLEVVSNIDLTLNSISASKTSMTTDETVEITINLTNNSPDDYDGEIGLFYTINASSNSLGNGEMFLIPAGEAKDCVVEFKPKRTGTYQITAFRPLGEGNYSTINNSIYASVKVTEGSGGSGGGGGELPTISDLDLTTSLNSLENANADKTVVYANDNESSIKAVVTVTNPSTTNNFKGTFYVYLRCPAYPGWYSCSYGTITIPAGGSYDFAFEYPVSDSDYGDTYQLTTCYVRNGSLTSEVNVGGVFKIEKGIFSYSADGTKTATEATGSYTVPEGALYVDLSGTGTTTVTKNSNPNCLYFFTNTDVVPASLTSNVIKKDGESYTAETITLTDGKDFFAPVDFTATSIEFTFLNDRWADGTGGWNTIMLPFKVTQVTANGTPIDWFHSSTDSGKQFWLKNFTSDGVSKVNFGFANAMNANTPYIIALPGSHWGSAYDLSGKTIKFIGSGEIKKSAQAMVTGDNYRFIGHTQAVTTENIYCINAAGNIFELKSSGGSAPFHPFFKAGSFDRSVNCLSIGNGGGTTGIEAIEWPQEIQSDKTFDLNGRQITKPGKGIVITNGRKVVKK